MLQSHFDFALISTVTEFALYIVCARTQAAKRAESGSASGIAAGGAMGAKCSFTACPMQIST